MNGGSVTVGKKGKKFVLRKNILNDIMDISFTTVTHEVQTAVKKKKNPKNIKKRI